MTPKRVTTTPDPSIAWAEKLWKSLENKLVDTEKVIIEIIKAKAWEPLGYESFSKAWVDRIMPQSRIGTALIPHVVYQLLSDGLTPDNVADTVLGVTPETVNDLKRQMDNGVPAGQSVVRRHHRRKPERGAWLHLEVGQDRMIEWRYLAKDHGGLEAFALETLQAAFTDLA